MRVPITLRGDLALLAQQDKRDDESDYWRKVLSDHVDEMRRSGRLPAANDNASGGVALVEVEVAAGGAR